MLFKPLLFTISITTVLCADLISTTEQNEFGAYINPNPSNICDGEELETLTICASEVLSKLDECKPDDLACECCALQSMKRDCYGLCPNTASGNFLAVLYDDCETMNDVNACNLPFKKHDSHVAKFLRPNARIPVEDKEPDFVIKSILENSTHIDAIVEDNNNDDIIYQNQDQNQNHSDEKYLVTDLNLSNITSVYEDIGIYNKTFGNKYSNIVLLIGLLILARFF